MALVISCYRLLRSRRLSPPRPAAPLAVLRRAPRPGPCPTRATPWLDALLAAAPTKIRYAPWLDPLASPAWLDAPALPCLPPAGTDGEKKDRKDSTLHGRKLQKGPLKENYSRRASSLISLPSPRETRGHTAMAVAVAVAGVTITCRSCSLTSAPPRSLPHRRRPAPPRASGAVEVRVCTNRTCARQGGREVLAALSGLAPPRVDVASCGCLGRCGAGPNVAASIAGRGAAVFGHVGTAACGAQLLEHLLGAAEFDAATGLAVLAAREKGEAALEKGNAAEAEALLTEAICLNACGGLHLVYSSRSKTRLTLGDISGALEDAEEAIRIAPKFPQAHLLRGDALLAMDEYCVAEDAYADALDLDPSIRRSRSFKTRVERLREKLVGASSSS
uniref:Uncharacterized protein n=1 Tax=Arundo donax TaxID=35708 RepID=A0A0A9DZ45_ARUDO